MAELTPPFTPEEEARISAIIYSEAERRAVGFFLLLSLWVLIIAIVVGGMRTCPAPPKEVFYTMTSAERDHLARATLMLGFMGGALFCVTEWGARAGARLLTRAWEKLQA